MPEKARIFWIENDAGWQATAQIFATMAGHTIVGVASTFEDAEEAVPGLADKEVQVVVMDGDLSGDGNFSNDGEILTAKINKMHPDIAVIGNATNRDVKGADVQATKLRAGGSGLAKAVTEIAFPINRPPRG